MNKKWLPYLVILLAITLFLGKRCKPDDPSSPKTNTGKKTADPASTVNRNHGFDRRVSYISYTEHAKCRMQCRKITQAEVEQIMKEGRINYNKTDVKARPCPAYALEGITPDDQRVRIVFAQCDRETKVVTCIDLGTDWECHCPGDDAKYKNKS